MLADWRTHTGTAGVETMLRITNSAQHLAYDTTSP